MKNEAICIIHNTHKHKQNQPRLTYKNEQTTTLNNPTHSPSKLSSLAGKDDRRRQDATKNRA